MASFNKVILIGHLTADPELKQTTNGVPVTSFSIGVNRRFTRQGEQAQTDFINIVCWRQTAEFVTRFSARETRYLSADHCRQDRGQTRTATNAIPRRWLPTRRASWSASPIPLPRRRAPFRCTEHPRTTIRLKSFRLMTSCRSDIVTAFLKGAKLPLKP